MKGKNTFSYNIFNLARKNYFFRINQASVPTESKIIYNPDSDDDFDEEDPDEDLYI